MVITHHVNDKSEAARIGILLTSRSRQEALFGLVASGLSCWMVVGQIEMTIASKAVAS
ncbi:hypothetical protein DL95DRAFT_387081, partial [Leptodontidium sp. 2 PMI_412]